MDSFLIKKFKFILSVQYHVEMAGDLERLNVYLVMEDYLIYARKKTNLTIMNNAMLANVLNGKLVDGQHVLQIAERVSENV